MGRGTLTHQVRCVQALRCQRRLVRLTDTQPLRVCFGYGALRLRNPCARWSAPGASCTELEEPPDSDIEGGQRRAPNGLQSVANLLVVRVEQLAVHLIDDRLRCIGGQYELTLE